MSSDAAMSGSALLQSVAASNPALHSHLTALISHLIQHQPSNAFQSFEKLSSHLLTPPPTLHPLLSSSPPPSVTSFLTSSPYLFNRPPPPTPTNPDDPPPDPEDPPTIPPFIPDLPSLTSLLSEAGLSPHPPLTLLLDRALTLLAQREAGVESIRYWGTLYTTSARDYHVFEVKKTSYDEDEEREKALREGGGGGGGMGGGGGEGGVGVWEGRELLGSGANEYAYYVTQDVHTPSPTFTQLPSTSPRLIQDARATRRLLRGDLRAAVGGFPRFAGVEADLVRAQVARISAGTVVVPRGAWKEEEGEVVLEDEGWRGVGVGERVEWVHARGHLRKDGRVEPPAEEDEEGGEEEDEGKRAEKAARKAAAFEAKRPLLAAVVGEVWTRRVHAGLDVGRVGEVKGEAGEEDGGEGGGAARVGVSELVSSCWSLLWPGAVSVVRGREYGSVYLGWGLKAGAGRVERLPAQEVEWVGELVERAEVLATEEEEKKEREDEEERKKEEGDKKADGEEEEDELPADEEAKEEED